MQALALKYRPRNFDELIGQNVIAQSLSHALDNDRISHAYLFSGLRGSGKTSSARIFAKALLCERGVSSHPCEICENCRMANEGRHMDIVEMDAASHRKIDDIRELIEQTKYAPASARYKIFIIDEVHMLTKEAFNALLKTLEEPPAYIKFILATTDPLKLPATILSRTQHFRFMPISRSDVVKHLEFILSKEGVKFEPSALEILARGGGGSLRDTLTLLDQAIIYSRGEVSAKSVADMLGLLDPEKIEEILRELNKECDVIFLDFHAETTSEKMAMGWYLDGRVNAVVGTHTHIQTADERILPQGTAYITDLGMVGPWNSILGVKTEIILQKFTTAMPCRFDLEESGPMVYSALIVDIDDSTNRTTNVERILIKE